MNIDNIKPFHKQIQECDKEGYREETEFFSFEQYPCFIPAFPNKKMIQMIKSGEWNGIDIVKCARFGGICNSGKPECKKIRGWPEDKINLNSEFPKLSNEDIGPNINQIV